MPPHEAHAVNGTSTNLPLRGLTSEIGSILRERSIPSWLERVDPEFGGYRVGSGDEQQAHHLLVTARLLWTFSHLHRRGYEPGDRLMLAATIGYRCLLDRLLDTEHGGFYWRIDPEGNGSDTRKFLYGHAFVMYALVEYWRAAGEPAALTVALDTFQLLMQRAHDEEYGGWLEHFSQDWQPLTRGSTVIEVVGRKSGNAHLHLMEALTELSLAGGGKEVNRALAEALEICQRYFYPAQVARGSALRHMDWRRDWFRRPSGLSWGHYVEAMWLCLRAEKALGRPLSWDALETVVRIASRRAEDRSSGGLLSKSVAHRRFGDRQRVWWVQAESVIALLTAFERSGDPWWGARLESQCRWILNHQIDPSDGLWFSSVSPAGGWRAGVDDTRKHRLWKAAYHEVRAMVLLDVPLAEIGAGVPSILG